jgi:hypothetical protein
MARHPAARDEPDAPPERNPRRITAAGRLWPAVLAPVALLVVVLAGGLTDTTPTDTVETFDPADRATGGGGSAGGRVVPSSVGDGPGRSPSSPSGPAPAGSSTTDGGGSGSGPPGSPAPGSAPSSERPAGGPGHEPGGPARAGDATGPAPDGTPRDGDDCRDGGWQHLVDDHGRPFANQGLCIAYVTAATGRP